MLHNDMVSIVEREHARLDQLRIERRVEEFRMCVVSMHNTDSRPALIRNSDISYGYLTRIISKTLPYTLTPP